MKITLEYNGSTKTIEIPGQITSADQLDRLCNDNLTFPQEDKTDRDHYITHNFSYSSNGKPLGYSRMTGFLDTLNELIESGQIITVNRTSHVVRDIDKYVDEKTRNTRRMIRDKSIIVGSAFLGTAALETIGLVLFGALSPDKYASFLNGISGYTGLVFAALGIALVAAVATFFLVLSKACPEHHGFFKRCDKSRNDQNVEKCPGSVKQ